MAPLTKAQRKLAWVDLETTGLDEQNGLILEAALVVTDENLDELESYEVVIHQKEDKLRWAMTAWALTAHKKSGLLNEVSTSIVNSVEAEDRMIEIIQRHFAEKAVMAGSSVHFDKRWITKHMPRLEKLFHYRIVDVSSFYEAYKVVFGYEPKRADVAHRAMGDIRGSIKFLKKAMTLAPLDVQKALDSENQEG